MKEWLRGLSSRTVTTVFAVLFLVPFVAALFPPLYLWGSHWKSGFVILGLPFSMWYWNVNALWIFFAIWALLRGAVRQGRERRARRALHRSEDGGVTCGRSSPVSRSSTPS